MSAKRLAFLTGAGPMSATLIESNRSSKSSIFLTVNDTTTGAGYVFDTGQTVTGAMAFTGNQSESFDVANSSAWNAFLSSVGPNDNLEWAVDGAEEPSPGTAPATLDTTGQLPPRTLTNSEIANAYIDVDFFLTSIANPAGGDSYQTASSRNGWYEGGWESSLNSSINVTDGTNIGSAMGFYQLTASNFSDRANGTSSAFVGTWLFTSFGELTYIADNTVPLPAPVALLISGLGLMTTIIRRRGSRLPALAGCSSCALY
jgi:hypothetical protein